MKEETIRKIVEFVDNASIVAFYTGRIFGNFRRGYRGCYTPMFENQDKQKQMQEYEAEMRRQDRAFHKESFDKDRELRVVGFS